MSVEPRGNQWRVRWRDEQGHNRSRTFNRQGAAHKFDEHVRELKALGRLDRLDERPRGLQTVQEWAAHWWETYAEPKLADATLDLYTLQLTLRIIPGGGRRSSGTLTPPRSNGGSPSWPVTGRGTRRS
jgi:hypothetical protein